MRWSRRDTTPLPAEPSCEQVGAVLQAYLDGELAPADTGLVVEHLEHCERCRIEADTMHRVIAAIQQQRPEVAPEVLDRLTAVVDDLAPPEDDDQNLPKHEPGG